MLLDEIRFSVLSAVNTGPLTVDDAHDLVVGFLEEGDARVAGLLDEFDDLLSGRGDGEGIEVGARGDEDQSRAIRGQLIYRC